MIPHKASNFIRRLEFLNLKWELFYAWEDISSALITV